jgi:hypothetical protein
MKWLFAILVALNIVVFGCMVAGKLVHAPSVATTASASSEVEIAAPATPDISVRNASTVTTNSTHTEINPNPVKPAIEAEAAPSTQKPKTEQKREAEASPATPATANCSATVIIPENDFHRIKGLLRQWPYTTKRFVEQVAPTTKPNLVPKPTRYIVALNSIDEETHQRLQEHGFDHGTSQGKVSLGIFNRREDAEALMARAKMKGFGEVYISTLERSDSANTATAPTSIAKIRVTFTGIDNSAVQDINKVTGRYGQIQRNGTCR